jgi:gamma-glutamylcyclotransferase (GGCT)/AIG2-like uncharacterized protein YtfP
VRTHRLFVYGSLKRGHRHHAELGGARFISVVRTSPAYRLLDFGTYPGLARGTRAIGGELFEVDDAVLERLDEFEGSDYFRTRIELSDGSTVEAYLVVDAITSGAREIEGGTWSDSGPESPCR